MMFNKQIGKIAFTLAEVLIVLGIIGIIADMTIPTLKRDIDKIVYITQLKKAYSSFQQGMQMIMVTEGVFSLDQTSLFETGDFSEEARQSAADRAIQKTFNIIKVCKGGEAGCEIENYKTLGKTIDGNYFSEQDDTYKFFTADGAGYQLWLNSSCEASAHSNVTTTSCGSFFLDINGPKKPNVIGRDLFSFYISSDGSIYPDYGTKYSEYDTGSSTGSSHWTSSAVHCGTKNSSTIPSTASGWGCAARIIEDGWKMDY